MRRDAGVLCGNMGGLRGEVGVRQRQPSSQCRNQRVLLEVAQLRGGGKQGHPMCRIDSPVTASRNFWDWLADYRAGVDLRPQRRDYPG